MRAFMLAVAVVGVFGSASADVYQVLHRRPSAILAMITRDAKPGDRVLRIVGDAQGLVQRGVIVTADDAASTLTVEGPKEQVADTIRLFKEFDVAAQQVIVTITVRSKADKYESRTETRVNNNSAWTLSDDLANLKLTVRPRINGDGTVSSSVEATTKEAHNTVVYRFKNRESFTLGFEGPELLMPTSDGTSFDVLERKQGPTGKRKRVPEPDLVVTISFAMIPPTGPAKIDPAARH